ncbi:MULTISPECIES: hypothetical protein [unclassified Crossiella]|uniref:hypothetical protein n=1 Tax=unclassified Crossiella TaxID=2620835 RepID=UPI001FFFECCB|nr:MULTISPECIES: hypothetical protein [unclassified Crossiella]MCK2244515.1 hypothetical protein [Crossiella sp. S99.2]MCK2258146.1 hypothetical protein [Crossiella sp. S99.1]
MRTHRLVPALGLILVLTACAHPGDTETDRQAGTLATAISYPRQSDAAGFARAALATNLGKSADFAVLVAREVPHGLDTNEQTAHLVIRIHRDAQEPSGILGSRKPALDACYEMNFNYYGIIGEPDRTACPKVATPYTPPPLPVFWQVPPDADEKLTALLRGLPAAPGQAEVLATVRTEIGLPQPDPADAAPRQGALVKVLGADVAVAVWAGRGESMDCIRVVRKAGELRTHGMSWREKRTGEGNPGCHPDTVLPG